MNKILLSDMNCIAKTFRNLDIFEDKIIVVTGGAGFLGFYIYEFFIYLMKNGINIKLLILLDNFILTKPYWVEKISKVDKQVKVYNFDISKDDIYGIDLAKEADFIISMASIASPIYYRKYPLETIDANVWGLRKLLEFYKDSSLEGFLFFSSSEIYGDPLPEFVPTPEEYRGNISCIGPRACYGEAKRFGETLCQVYASIYNIPIRIVRPFNNYGPGMKLDDRRVTADFARCIVNNEDIIMHSDGTPTRTFCYVADAISGYLKVLTYKHFDYFNIGMDTSEISIRKLAEIYKEIGKELFGYKGKIVYKESENNDYLTHCPLHRCPDITKAKRLLNFSPSIKIEEGVKRFLLYLQEERSK